MVELDKSRFFNYEKYKVFLDKHAVFHNSIQMPNSLEHNS